MSTKKKYDAIIEFIDQAIAEGVGSKAGDIAERVTKEMGQGITLREMTSIMGFMTGDSLIEYIKKQQMMKAYTSIIEDADGGVESAIAYTGLGDQPTFTKSFRKQFDITPGEARKRKDRSIIFPPQFWDVISGEGSTIDNTPDLETARKDVDAITEPLIFGITKERLARITEALDLQVVYSFSDNQSGVAFTLSEKYGIPMRKAFDFVDDYTLQIYPEADDSEKYSTLASDIVNAKNLVFTYFDLGLSISQSIDIIGEMAISGIDNISGEDREFLDECLSSQFSCYSLKDLKKLFTHYESLQTQTFTFNDFLVSYSLTEDLEAAEYLAENPGGEDYRQVLTPEQQRKSLENWAVDDWEQEETDFTNSDRFDSEPDMDNIAYENDNEDNFFGSVAITFPDDD
jgi:AraC-like DNA-binding protein